MQSKQKRAIACAVPARRGDGAFSIILMLAAVTLLWSLAFLMQARAASNDNAAEIWQSGDMRVVTLQDRPGNSDIELFSGPASPEERGRYFTDNKTPAGINAFLIRTKDKNILVDTGYGPLAPGQSGLVPALEALGLKPENIDVVLLTHMHMDHIGGLLDGDKRAFPKAKIHAAKAEIDYWLGLADKDPAQPNAALALKTQKAYGPDMTAFAFGDKVLPDVIAIEAVGHTPGHTVFHLQAGDKSLLIVGDLVHAAALQFPLPDECARYDMDMPEAVKARKRILDLAAENKWQIAGMHMPFPATGMVEKDGAGYRLVTP